MPDRPNIILITCHDLGQHLGCYGVPTVDTPHIDALAERGVRFRRSFCAAPQCSPSRATIATGRYPHSNGVMGLTHDGFKWDFHDSEVHLAQRLSESAWHTAQLGVVHETRDRQRLGFDELLDLPAPHKDEPRALRLARQAEAFLESRAGAASPFYLQLGFDEPHRDPWHATHWHHTNRPARREVTVPAYLVDDEDARQEMGYFEASVRTVDDAVGRIMAQLERFGLAGRTLVIFTADHGIPFPRAKCSLYDPGLEVPLIMHWPEGPWPAGAVHDAMISNLDYAPTLYELLDVSGPDGMQGESFAPLLRGEPYKARDAIFAEMTYHDYYDPIRAIRTETHKLIVSFCYNKAFMDPTQQWRPKTRPVHPAAPVSSRHALVELYDLREDPLERVNLADDPAHAALRGELLSRLHQWMVDTEDPLLQGVPVSSMHREALKALEAASTSAGADCMLARAN